MVLVAVKADLRSLGPDVGQRIGEALGRGVRAIFKGGRRWAVMTPGGPTAGESGVPAVGAASEPGDSPVCGAAGSSAVGCSEVDCRDTGWGGVVRVRGRGPFPWPAPSEGWHPTKPASPSATQAAAVTILEDVRGRGQLTKGQLRLWMLPACRPLVLSIGDLRVGYTHGTRGQSTRFQILSTQVGQSARPGRLAGERWLHRPIWPLTGAALSAVA